jgi:hypothetical protein
MGRAISYSIGGLVEQFPRSSEYGCVLCRQADHKQRYSGSVIMSCYLSSQVALKTRPKMLHIPMRFLRLHILDMPYFPLALILFLLLNACKTSRSAPRRLPQDRGGRGPN